MHDAGSARPTWRPASGAARWSSGFKEPATARAALNPAPDPADNHRVITGLQGRCRARRVGAAVSAVVVAACLLSACRPPAVATPAPKLAPPATTPPAPGSTLPAPTWWSGPCDSANDAGAHPLGASYRGVQVCGPRPGADAAPDRAVQFFPGAWGELEWECVELAMRYLYLADGVSPYGANGKDVVANYTTASGGNLVKVPNATPGDAPAPGDVISFGPTATSPLGHAGVVESASVDANGNGTVRILSQNDTADGWRTLNVTSWSVDGPGAGLGAVAAWLHAP